MKLTMVSRFFRLTVGRTRGHMASTALVAAAAVAVPALAETPTMLTQLERGRWQLTDRSGGAARNICLGDATQLIQVRHANNRCASYTVENGTNVVTVGYDCQAAGNGRTTVRRETNRLVQIETQGMVNGAPFSQNFEARRVGACS